MGKGKRNKVDRHVCPRPDCTRHYATAEKLVRHFRQHMVDLGLSEPSPPASSGGSDDLVPSGMAQIAQRLPRGNGNNASATAAQPAIVTVKKKQSEKSSHTPAPTPRARIHRQKAATFIPIPRISHFLPDVGSSESDPIDLSTPPPPDRPALPRSTTPTGTPPPAGYLVAALASTEKTRQPRKKGLEIEIRPVSSSPEPVLVHETEDELDVSDSDDETDHDESDMASPQLLPDPSATSSATSLSPPSSTGVSYKRPTWATEPLSTSPMVKRPAQGEPQQLESCSPATSNGGFNFPIKKARRAQDASRTLQRQVGMKRWDDGVQDPSASVGSPGIACANVKLRAQAVDTVTEASSSRYAYLNGLRSSSSDLVLTQSATSSRGNPHTAEPDRGANHLKQRHTSTASSGLETSNVALVNVGAVSRALADLLVALFARPPGHANPSTPSDTVHTPRSPVSLDGTPVAVHLSPTLQEDMAKEAEAHAVVKGLTDALLRATGCT